MRHHRHAFTLVELLVVIGIISLLISILLPSLARARQSANSLVCLSNLRTMGQGLLMYADQNKGSLPYGAYGGDAGVGAADWAILLTGTMKSGENTYAQTPRLKIFWDADTIPGGELHYSSHPRLMPYIGNATFKNPDPVDGTPLVPYKLGKIQRSSEIAILWDGNQIMENSFNSDAVSVLVDGYRLSYSSRLYYAGYAKNDQSVDPGKNVDPEKWSSSGTSNIRWRHLGNATANFLFVDGHAESRRLGTNGTTSDLLRGNINVNK